MNSQNVIEKLKNHFNIQKDIDLAKFLGVKQNSISTWKKRNTIALKTILPQLKGVNLNWLFKDEYPVNIDTFEQQLLDKQTHYISERKIVEIVQKGGSLPIILIPEKASAGYSKGFGNDLHREYRTMQFMDYKDGNRYRCFEIQGDSMENVNSPTSIQSGDYVLGEKVENSQTLKNDTIYIFCTEEGILCKRLEITKEKLILHSNNEKYPPKPIEKQEVTEIWKVIWVHRELK